MYLLSLQIDSKKIYKIATGELESEGESLLKVWCEKEKVPRIVNDTASAMVSNATGVPTAAAATTTLSGLNKTTTGYPHWWDWAFTPTQGTPSKEATTAAAGTTNAPGPVTEMVEVGVEKCKHCCYILAVMFLHTFHEESFKC